MNFQLTKDQQQAIKAQHGAPVYVIDADTNESCVLLPARQYQTLKAVAGDKESEDLYPLLAEISPEDWEDASLYALPQS